MRAKSHEFSYERDQLRVNASQYSLNDRCCGSCHGYAIVREDRCYHNCSSEGIHSCSLGDCKAMDALEGSNEKEQLAFVVELGSKMELQQHKVLEMVHSMKLEPVLEQSKVLELALEQNSKELELALVQHSKGLEPALVQHSKELELALVQGKLELVQHSKVPEPASEQHNKVLELALEQHNNLMVLELEHNKMWLQEQVLSSKSLLEQHKNCVLECHKNCVLENHKNYVPEHHKNCEASYHHILASLGSKICEHGA